MRELKVSVGVWYLGATSDRFVKEGYGPDRTMEEHFKLAASIEGVGGLEMHYPTEVTDNTYKSLKALAYDLGLKIVQFCPHLWVDRRWQFGQFSNPDQVAPCGYRPGQAVPRRGDRHQERRHGGGDSSG